MAVDSKSVGEKIRDIRKKNNMTQVKFAERLHMTQQTISRYENGNSPIPNDVVENISKEFCVPFSYFLGIDTDNFSEDEMCLIEYYRKADNQFKKRILEMVKVMVEDL